MPALLTRWAVLPTPPGIAAALGVQAAHQDPMHAALRRDMTAIDNFHELRDATLDAPINFYRVFNDGGVNTAGDCGRLNEHLTSRSRLPSFPKLVLLHRFPAPSHQYRRSIPKLTDLFQIVAPDYPIR
jgi:hypothetical protein